MRHFVTISCFVVLCMLHSSCAEDSQQASVEEINTAENAMEPNPFISNEPTCEDRICTRIYRPVCALVDGTPMTAPSRCELNNKIRCVEVLRRSIDEDKVPEIEFLHSGPCRATPKTEGTQRQNSKRTRWVTKVEMLRRK